MSSSSSIASSPPPSPTFQPPLPSLSAIPLTVQPPSPDELMIGDNALRDGLQPADSPVNPIPRRPMHRSISIPLSQRMGGLRHPRPRIVAKTSEPNVTITAGGSGRRSSSSPGAVPQSPERRSMRPSLSASSGSLTESDVSSSTALAHLILDTLQLPISHLLHIIPPHLLDASHETLSATSLSLPVTSVEAVMEAFRSINWICDAFIERDLTSSGKASVPEHLIAQDAASRSEIDPSRSGPGKRTDTASMEPTSSTARRWSRSGSTSPSDRTKQDPSFAFASSSSPTPTLRTFDISELTQRAADVVSGQAADKAIDVVLALTGTSSDSDVLTNIHAIATGDEGAVKCVLIHAMSRLLALGPRHSTLIIRLKATPEVKMNTKQTPQGTPCSFELRLACSNSDDLPDRDVMEHSLDDSVLQIAQARCKWTRSKTSTESTVELEFDNLAFSGEEVSNSAVPSTSESEGRQRFLPRLALGEEPTAQQLSAFVRDELRGKSVALHALESSTFAQNLAQLLQACGCHVSIGAVAPTEMPGPSASALDNAGERPLPAARTAIAFSKGRPAFVRYSTGLALAGHRGSNVNEGGEGSLDPSSATAVLDPVTGVPLTLPSDQDDPAASRLTKVGMERGSSTDTIKHISPPDQLDAYSFVMVDDDIETLQRELLRLRSALPLLRGALGQSTPSAQHSNRTSKDGFPLRSGSGGDLRVLKPSSELTHAIVYFTSVVNFRSIRDVLQPIMESAIQSVGEGQAYTLPEILVVPKPAGSRRILTALKTAVHKPIVDPFFAPLATSPMSPYLWVAKIGKREGGELREGTPLTERSRQFTSTSSPGPSPRDNRLLTPKERSLQLSGLPTPDLKAVLRDRAVEATRGINARDDKPPSPGSAEIIPEQRPSLLPLLTPSVRSSQGSGSPLPAETLEYFSEAAARMGSSAASGLVIQSPDGRPAALYFDPNLSGGASGKGSQGRRASSVSDALSNHRPPLLRGSEASNAVVGGSRRRSEDRHIFHHPSIADVLGSRTGAITDSDGMPSTDLSRRGSTESVSSYTTRLKFADAPAGTLFAPQVGIDDVLSSGKLPVATPIGSGTILGENSDSTLLIPTTRPKSLAAGATVVGQADHDTARLSADQAPSRAPTSSAAVRAPAGDGCEAGSVEKTVTTAPLKGGRLASGKLAAPDAEGNGELIRELDGQVRGVHPSFAAASPATKPSAQPQSGLLIGAGFSSSGRRGGGPRKIQVREKVLPPIKVLIVEDNPINQRILKQFMTKKKIKFETAVNGREAVDKWATGGFHLILMDIQLPVMDGIEATKEIRKQELSANVGQLPATPPVHTAGILSPHGVGGGGLVDLPAPPSAGMGSVSLQPLTSASSSAPSAASVPFRASVIIVALTASVLNSDRVAALAAGCNDFLNKPVSLPWLEKKIIEWGSMQYILLSGAGVFDAERKAQRLLRGQGAAAAAASSSDVRRGFGSNPDVQAKLLASKLHLPPKRRQNTTVVSPRSGSKVSSSPSALGVNGLGGGGGDERSNVSASIAGAGNIQIGGRLTGPESVPTYCGKGRDQNSESGGRK